LVDNNGFFFVTLLLQQQISENEDEVTNRKTDSDNPNTERLEACSTKASSKSLSSNLLNSSLSSLSKIIIEKKEKEVSNMLLFQFDPFLTPVDYNSIFVNTLIYVKIQ